MARRESSKLLIARIKQIAGTDATVFATGDFNAVPTDEPMVTLASDGLLLDSYDLSEQPRYGTEGTYNSFKTDSEMMNRIDYIWVTKGTKVKSMLFSTICSTVVSRRIISRDDTSHVLKFI